METKGAKDVSTALYSILTSIKDLKKVNYRVLIQCDEGKEFYNKEVKDVLKSFNNIKLYSTRSDHKAAFAESVIRTIRASLVRSMEDNGPTWIDQIDSIVRNYNDGYHSTIKMSPSLAEEEFPLALTNIISQRKQSIKGIVPRYQVNEQVRIFAKQKKGHFRKGTLRKWSAEVFTITNVRKLKTKYVYKLKDKNDEPIIGTFDENDLQPGTVQSVYKFHVLDTRKRGKNTEYFVHWDGFPSSDDSWVKEKDLV